MNEEIRKMMLQEEPGGVFTARLAAAEEKVRAALIQVGAKGYYPPAGQYGESLFAAAKECGETVLYESYAAGRSGRAARGRAFVKKGLLYRAAKTEPAERCVQAAYNRERRQTHCACLPPLRYLDIRSHRNAVKWYKFIFRLRRRA